VQDLHRDLIGRDERLSPGVGSVVVLAARYPGYAVLDASGDVVGPVVPYVGQLALDDNRPLTGGSYTFGMLCWYRLLWFPRHRLGPCHPGRVPSRSPSVPRHPAATPSSSAMSSGIPAVGDVGTTMPRSSIRPSPLVYGHR
jgi:hypothetical protein